MRRHRPGDDVDAVLNIFYSFRLALPTLRVLPIERLIFGELFIARRQRHVLP
ncbi:hypothetical protein C8D96_0963 [Kushneria marisflavi]|nr:hypothetical protein C8D96_0963 [Kushneria marisflavi]